MGANTTKTKINSNTNIKFKEIDDELVLKMYEQMLESGRLGKNKITVQNGN